MDHLDFDSCNKGKCKSCIFGPSPISLLPERVNEIYSYLIKFEASHICHTTNKTCYGGLELQAKVLYANNIINEPTVSALLNAAKIFLNHKK